MKACYSFLFLGLLGLSLGTSVAQGSDVDAEADAVGTDSVMMMYETYPARFTCNFTDSDDSSTSDVPSPILKWFKDDEPIVVDDRVKIFQENSTLLIMTAEREDVGNYTCRTDAEEEPVSKTIKLIFLEIRKMDKSQNVDEKENLVIECMTDGTPAPTIVWLKNQKPITEHMVNDSRISIGPNNKNVQNGTLTVNSAQWSDRGNYSCVITSLLQTYERWTFVRVKDVYAALWPFIGIVLEVVILGIIIVIFERRRAKAEFDESDTDQGNDQKNKGKDRRRK